MLDEVEKSGDATVVVKGLDRGDKLMGFGHRVYRAEDPRARTLRRTAKELGARRVEVAEALEKAAIEELTARYPDRPRDERGVLVGGGAGLRRGPAAHVHVDVHLRPDGRVERAHHGAEAAEQADPAVRRYQGPGPRKPEEVEGWDEMQARAREPLPAPATK